MKNLLVFAVSAGFFCSALFLNCWRDEPVTTEFLFLAAIYTAIVSFKEEQ